MSDIKTEEQEKEKRMIALRSALRLMELKELDKDLPEDKIFAILFNTSIGEYLHPIEIINLAFRFKSLKNDYPNSTYKISCLDKLLEKNDINSSITHSIREQIKQNENERELIMTTWQNIMKSINAKKSEDTKTNLINDCNFIMVHCNLYMSPVILDKIYVKYPELKTDIGVYQLYHSLSNPLCNELPKNSDELNTDLKNNVLI